jgi:oligosaccharide repeat unit polymerase
MLFDPRLVFLLLWSTQIAGQLMAGDIFGQYSALTWSAIACAILGFAAGSTLGASIPIMRGGGMPLPTPAQRAPFVRRALYWFVFLYGIATLLVLAKVYLILRGQLGGAVTLPSIRQAFVSDFVGPRTIFGLLRVFFFGVGVCIYFVANARSLSLRELLFVLTIGLVSALLTTGRLYMLMLFVAVTALLYRQRIVTLRGVLGAGLGFMTLFFLVAVLLGKGTSSGGVLRQVTWNAQVYLLSSVACFDNYVQTGLQQIPGGALLPNSVRGFLHGFGVNIPLRPPLMPFVSVPMTCNTYTALFPLYHDGSLPGVLVGFLGIGFFHQLLYKWNLSSENPVAWYFYAVSLYPLCMSIFEDSYFSSPGFWILLWLPPMLLWLSGYVLRRSRARAIDMPN